MIRRLSTLAILCLLPITVQAQQPHNAEVTIIHRGIDSLKADVSALLSLTTKEEQRQQENLIGTIELIELGIDQNRPLRVDILTGFSTPFYVVQVGYVEPVEDIIDNIGFNFTLKKRSPTLWEILPPDAGWFRIIPEKKTAIMILTDKGSHQLLKQLILKIEDPLPDASALLGDNASVAARLLNTALTKEDQDKRRAGYQETKMLQLDALQKRPNETQTGFALRKGLISNQLLEIERMISEAAEAKALIGFNRETFQATINFDATAIAGTSFAETLEEFGQNPDHFASVAKPENSVFSLRANHPVDSLRQANVNRTMDLMQADAKDRLDSNKAISEEARTAASSLINTFLQVARDTVANGNLNGFWEKIPAEKNEFTGYGAIAVKDGNRLVEALKQLAESESGNSIEASLETVGDVVIHKLQFKKGFFSLFDLLFDGKVGYLGTSEDKIWIATGGEAALAPLKAAIQELKDPETNDVILTMNGNLLPFVEQTIRVVKRLEPASTDTQKKARRDYLRQLEIAAESLQTEDEASFRMDVADGKAQGLITFDRGTLKFVARLLANYSENNLE
ncbi:MAG: hypothetical protein ABJZ55_12260 [Fuerstiella sp.]